jgi:ribA/ribD-fused uncharacterized protein
MTDEIRFYRATGKYGFLSNLYPCRVAYYTGGESKTVFASAEHAYQWFKAKDEKTKEWIRLAPYPRLAAVVGHGLFPYDVMPNWNKNKVIIMRNVLLNKFGSNPNLADKLLETGDAFLIEDSKTDSYWGIGRKGGGQNQLGKCLMDVRKLIRGKRDGYGATRQY